MEEVSGHWGDLGHTAWARAQPAFLEAEPGSGHLGSCPCLPLCCAFLINLNQKNVGLILINLKWSSYQACQCGGEGRVGRRGEL